MAEAQAPAILFFCYICILLTTLHYEKELFLASTGLLLPYRLRS